MEGSLIVPSYPCVHSHTIHIDNFLQSYHKRNAMLLAFPPVKIIEFIRKDQPHLPITNFATCLPVLSSPFLIFVKELFLLSNKLQFLNFVSYTTGSFSSLMSISLITISVSYLLFRRRRRKRSQGRRRGGAGSERGRRKRKNTTK